MRCPLSVVYVWMNKWTECALALCVYECLWMQYCMPQLHGSKLNSACVCVNECDCVFVCLMWVYERERECVFCVPVKVGSVYSFFFKIISFIDAKKNSPKFTGTLFLAPIGRKFAIAQAHNFQTVQNFTKLTLLVSECTFAYGRNQMNERVCTLCFIWVLFRCLFRWRERRMGFKV